MANFYRVKNGNWNLADSWATTSGGTTYHAAPPKSSDDVFFDANTPTGTHTVNTTANTLSLDFTGFTGTLAGTSTLNVYGSLTLGAGMTRTYTGQLSFLGTAAASLTSNGISLDRIYINNASKVLTLQDKLTLNRSSLDSRTFANIYLQAGTFTHNNQDVELTGANSSIDGALTFYNLIKTGISATSVFLVGRSITITNVLTITGNSAINRIFVKSDTPGTARTITAATVTVTNADFQDITGAGAGSWDLSAITGGSGDCGGNTDITFTTADDWYWHADTGNVSDYSKWYTATNGGGSQMASTRVPLPQDTLRFDDSSFTAGSKTVTQNMPRIGSIDFTGATNTPTFTTSTDCSAFGSLTLISGMVLTASAQDYDFSGRGSYTFNTAGNPWPKDFEINAPGGSLTLKSDLSFTTNAKVFRVTNGTFNSVDGATEHVITFGKLGGVANGATLNLGSSTHFITGDGIALGGTGGIVGTISGTYTLKFTGAPSTFATFVGGGKSYYNIWVATTGVNPFLMNNSSNTFNDFKIDAGREVNFTAGTNTTVTTFTAEGTDVAPITLTSNTTSAATLTKAGGGTITVKYCDISYLTATPADTWLAYTTDGNVDSGNNTGWTFVGGDTRRRAAFIKFF